MDSRRPTESKHPLVIPSSGKHMLRNSPWPKGRHLRKIYSPTGNLGPTNLEPTVWGGGEDPEKGPQCLASEDLSVIRCTGVWFPGKK